MDDAIRLLKTQQMKSLPFDPTEFGFVYPSAEIALEQHRRDRLLDSLLAEKAAFNLTKYAASTDNFVAPAISSPVGFLLGNINAEAWHEPKAA